jgi:tetratricopeptide (TPR) repeat protein
MPSARAATRRPWFVAAALALIFGSWAAADWRRAAPPDALRQAKYVGRDSCVQCHQAAAAEYHGSDHDRAMEPATEETVLGDFNDAEFERQGEVTRFFRDGEKFMVNAEGPDGKNHDYQVSYTFGIRPLQQYMVEFPDGRIQVLRVSWDTRKNKWFYVAPPDAEDLRLDATDPLHWTGLAQNWNTMCAECHVTDYRPNFDLATNSYHSEYNEIDVSCEACHGPGSLHVETAQRKTFFWDRNVGYGLTNKLKNASNVQQMETCAPCHSRRALIHADYRAGDSFYDGYDPLLLFQGLYHADGQIQDEVYELGSFTQSKMYHKGVRCTDCHNPHSLELKFPGNRLCAQCHQPGKYDGAGHHHHANAIDGAPETQCVSCHMPSTTYMAIDERRDHSLRVPRPDLSVELQTPNACNRCHTKPTEGPDWAAEAIVKWYGPQRPDDPHFARAIAAARDAKPEGERLLRELLDRDGVPDFVRATAVSLLAGYPTASSERAQRNALDDPHPVVRAAAIRGLQQDPLAGVTRDEVIRLSEEEIRTKQREFITELLRDTAPMLSDSARNVRIAAASRLVSVASALEESGYRTQLEGAIKEFRTAHDLHLDRADSHLAIASLEEQLARVSLEQTVDHLPKAIESFRAAILVEPYRSGPRRELARLLDAIDVTPRLAQLRHSMDIDRAEIAKLRREEVDLLARDAKLVPNNPRPLYQRGLLLYQLGDLDSARQSLAEATRVDPKSYESWMALALICEKQQRWVDAARAIEKMKELQPEAEDWKGVLMRIRESMKRQRVEEAADAPHSESLSPEEATAPPEDEVE